MSKDAAFVLVRLAVEENQRIALIPTAKWTEERKAGQLFPSEVHHFHVKVWLHFYLRVIEYLSETFLGIGIKYMIFGTPASSHMFAETLSVTLILLSCAHSIINVVCFAQSTEFFTLQSERASEVDN